MKFLSYLANVYFETYAPILGPDIYCDTDRLLLGILDFGFGIFLSTARLAIEQSHQTKIVQREVKHVQHPGLD